MSRRDWLSLLAGLLTLPTLPACGEDSDDESPEDLSTLEPKRVLTIPEGYTGPIDPEWPPSHPESLLMQLEAARLVRERLVRGEPAFQVSEDGALHVERGQLGVFSYLEAIAGRPKHPDDPMPLVVILHGRGGKAQVPEAAMSTEIPVRFFMPQAPDRVGDGYTWLAARTLEDEEQLLTRSLSARADQLQPIIEAFRKLRPTLGKPIIAGFSQGGMMTFALGTRYPSRYAAAFPIAGWLPPALYPAGGGGTRFPYFYAQHGGADTVVPTELGRTTVNMLRGRGVRVDYREHPGVGHVVTSLMHDEVRRGMARIFEAFRGSVVIR